MTHDYGNILHLSISSATDDTVAESAEHTMCNYWLHILEHDPHVEGCTLALSVSPTGRDVDGGKLHTLNSKSWDELAEVRRRWESADLFNKREWGWIPRY